MKRLVLCALLSSAPLTHALAEGNQAAVSPTAGLLQTLVGLIVVIGLIFGAGWLMRRVAPQGMSRGPIRIIASAAVGPRERVVVVHCQDEILTLGVAPGQVSLLQSRPAPANTAPVLEAGAGESAGAAFAARLKNLLARGSR